MAYYDAERHVAEMVSALDARRRGKEWVSLCPGHSERTPSFGFRAEGDRVLVHCLGGCAQDHIIDSLRQRGLWHENGNGNGNGSIRQWLEVLDHDQIKGVVAATREMVKDALDGNLVEVEDGFLGRTDTGNASRMVLQHGQNIRYCAAWKRWLIWDGTCFRVDPRQGIILLAQETVRTIATVEAAQADEETAKKLRDHAAKSQAKGRLDAMIALASAQPGVAVTPAELDQSPWLLNCQNGTLDLRFGELRSHRRADNLTKCAPVEYDAEAECPHFMAFMQRIFNGSDEMIAFVCRALAYALTGLTIEHCLFILHGAGRNGKSTLLGVVERILGDYASRARVETFMASDRSGIPNDLAALAGARFVVTMEAASGQRLSEGLVKEITGGDKVRARFLHAEYFDYYPQFKLFMGTNHRPTIRDTTHGMWSRIFLIPFLVTIPKEDIDQELPEKLWAERSGILALLLRSCLDWRKDGLRPPTEVLAATQDYREEMDLLGHFLGDCCVVGSGFEVTSSALYAEYEQWCGANGERPMSRVRFGRQMIERGIAASRLSDSSRARLWAGIGLVSDGVQPQENRNQQDLFDHDDEPGEQAPF